ncbi:MAG: nucleotidyltransferase [Thermoleophilia bacterium]
MPSVQAEHLVVALKRIAAALRDAEIEFALGGGLAAWARGGPPTDNDIDLLIREEDARRAIEVASRAGLRVEVPPEGWLVKAWDGEVLIDLIHHPTGLPVDDALMARCDELVVRAVAMRVVRVDDLLTSKLLALGEHNLDLSPTLRIARALREQIDWDVLWQRTSCSPYARTFFTLVRELRVLSTASVVRPVEVA